MNNDDNINNTSGMPSPYKASRNLNTAIGNPSVNINDTMNINIQNMATNSIPVNNQTPIEAQVTDVKAPINKVENTYNPNVNNLNNSLNNINIQNDINQNNINTSNVTRTYVSADNKPKKKKLVLNLGSEFKIALLIIVILLVFIFILPMITNLLKGY